MKPVLVKTSAGVCYVSAPSVVPLIGDDAKEVLAAELANYKGSVGLFEKEGVEVDLPFVVSTMLDVIPGYGDVRPSVYTKEKFGPISYETTKLRRDIIEALAKNEPDLFERDEMENLKKIIYKADGRDFSRKTYSRMITYLDDKVKGLNITTKHKKDSYTRTAYRCWLSGKTIHPIELDVAVQIAYAIGSNEFGERAIDIWDPDIPKGKKDYYTLVDIHRTGRAIFAPAKGEGTGYSRATAESKERVHPEFVDWYAKLAEVLRPMMEMSIIEATIFDATIPEKKEESPPGGEKLGLKRQLVTSDREGADEMYKTLKRTRPRSRSNVLEGLLNEWVGLTKEAYEKFYDLYEFDIKIHEDDKRVYEPGTKVHSYSFRPWKNDDGEIITVPNTDNNDFLSPLFKFDTKILIASYDKLQDILSTVTSSRMKKKVSKGFRKGDPDFVLLRPFLRNIYDPSLVLRSMYDFDTFCKDITRIERTKSCLDLYDIDPERVKTRQQNHDYAREHSLKKNMLEFASVVEKEKVSLQEISRELPPEITISNSFLKEINTLNQRIPIAGRTSVEVFGEIFDFYGLDYDLYRRNVTDIFLHLHDRVLKSDPQADQKWE